MRDTSSIFVLFVGSYHRRRTFLVTEDVKLVAKRYVEKLKEDESVDVEIWQNNQRIGWFDDYEKVEAKVKKALSKMAMQIKE